MTAFQPFDGAVNRTAVVSADMQSTTRYPVPYINWQRTEEFAFEDELDKVESRTTRADCFASPVGDRLSPWMIVPDRDLFATLKKLSGGVGGYRAWKGADTRGGNGIFWLQVMHASRGTVLCRNTPEFSKKKPPQKEWGFEPDLIYPLLRGRETRRWHAAPSLCLLFPHKGDRAMEKQELQTDYPKTWGYIDEMEAHLRKRRQYDLSRKSLAFWSLFETGPFLTAPYKVVWKYIASSLTCAVVDGHRIDGLTNRVVIPDHKLVIVPLKTRAEAHYVCAALNSAVARFLAQAYVVGTQISTHILEFVKVPPFKPADAMHAELSELSVECHKRASKGDAEGVRATEAELDALAAKLWGVTKRELKAIQQLQTVAEEAGDEEHEE